MNRANSKIIFHTMAEDGRYGCHDEDLNECMGLWGEVCKHIIVLLVGMSQNGDLDPKMAYKWAGACHGKRPKKDQELATQLLLRYRGAQVGEIDWRPTETIPEDFYVL